MASITCRLIPPCWCSWPWICIGKNCSPASLRWTKQTNKQKQLVKNKEPCQKTQLLCQAVWFEPRGFGSLAFPSSHRAQFDKKRFRWQVLDNWSLCFGFYNLYSQTQQGPESLLPKCPLKCLLEECNTLRCPRCMVGMVAWDRDKCKAKSSKEESKSCRKLGVCMYYHVTTLRKSFSEKQQHM